jgi:hypothetical protein
MEKAAKVLNLKAHLCRIARQDYHSKVGFIIFYGCSLMFRQFTRFSLILSFLILCIVYARQDFIE